MLLAHLCGGGDLRSASRRREGLAETHLEARQHRDLSIEAYVTWERVRHVTLTAGG